MAEGVDGVDEVACSWNLKGGHDTLRAARFSPGPPPSRVRLARPPPPMAPAGHRLLPELPHPPRCARPGREAVGAHRARGGVRLGQVRGQIRAELRFPPSSPPPLMAMATGASLLADCMWSALSGSRLPPAKPQARDAELLRRKEWR